MIGGAIAEFEIQATVPIHHGKAILLEGSVATRSLSSWWQELDQCDCDQVRRSTEFLGRFQVDLLRSRNEGNEGSPLIIITMVVSMFQRFPTDDVM